MTTYNTGNPIGSKDPRDLYDNAENLDEAVNTRTEESWDDRFGVARKTWWGMEQDFQQFLLDSGYVNIGDYAAGLEITARNQIFWRDGELYRAGAVLELPYTTTGDWGSEEGLFVGVGDAALRAQLSSRNGISLVGGIPFVTPFSFGALGDGTTDDTLAFQAASERARDIHGVLYIPNYDFKLDGSFEVYTDVVCHGTIYIDSGIIENHIVFPENVVAELNASDVLFEMWSSDTILRMLPTFTGEIRDNLADYYLAITSTEMLQERLGDPERATAYTKNQTVNIVTNSGNIASEILYTANDLSLFTLRFHKKQDPIKVSGLKIRLLGNSLASQRLVLSQRNDVTFVDLDIKGLDGGAVEGGVELREALNTIFIRPNIRNLGRDGFDTYHVVNYRSSFVYFYNYQTVHSNGYPNNAAYVARHGDHVYFFDCNTPTLDDHFGSNYFVVDCNVRGHVGFAGKNITIKGGHFSHTEAILRVRTDTPYCEGVAKISDCKISRIPNSPVSPNVIYYTIGGTLDDRPYNRDMKVFDEINISNITMLGGKAPFGNPAPSSQPGAIRIYANFTNSEIVANNRLLVGKINIRDMEWPTYFLYATPGDVETIFDKISFNNTEMNVLQQGTTTQASVRIVGNNYVAPDIQFANCKNPHTGLSTTNDLFGRINFKGCVFDKDNPNDSPSMALATYRGVIRFTDCSFYRRGDGGFNFPQSQAYFHGCYFDSLWSAFPNNYGLTTYSTGTTGTSNSKPVNSSSGVSAVPAGQESVAVAHNWPSIPRASEIRITPTNRNGAFCRLWVHSITANTFTVTCETTPTTSPANFSWAIVAE